MRKSSLVRVLIYAHFFAPSVGGVETYARLLAEGLPERAEATGTEGLEVVVVTHTLADPTFDSAFPFQVVRHPGWIQLSRLIRSAAVIQLVGPSLLPMFLAVVFRRPFVVEQHGYQAVCPNGLLLYGSSKEVCPGHFLARRYHKCLQCNRSVGLWNSLKMLMMTFPRRWLCRRAAANLAITSHVELRLALPRTHVIYYGVPDPFTVSSDRFTTGWPEGSNVPQFAYVGRLVSEKGALVLVQAAHRVREQGYDFHLKLVGDGPERGRLEAAVAASGLQQLVTFTGFLGGKQLEQALSDVAVVVMPSICEETAGLAAIEQMFRGKLVIAAEIGGLAEVVGSAGLKFPAGDAEALANCMRQVLDKPDIVSECGRRARKRALDCFGLDRMLDQHLALYTQVASL